MFLRLTLASLVLLGATSTFARRLKVFDYPKQIGAGQVAKLTFENPDPENPIARSSCVAEKLISWVKSDIPIVRIEQNGKQIWTSIGSYSSMGDSAIATIVIPTTLVPGEATLYVVDMRDASVPYKFTVIAQPEVKLTKLEGTHVTPLRQFRLIGTGFLPTVKLDRDKMIGELENNIGYSKLSLDAQYTNLARLLVQGWDKEKQGNFLYIEQGGKTWRGFVDQCSVTPDGIALDFVAPPDLKSGTATMALAIRQDGKETARSAPLTVTIK